MKIKLECHPDRYEKLKRELESRNITVSNESNLVLTEINYSSKFIFGNRDNEIELLSPSDVLYVESFGSEVYAHTLKSRYFLKEKLYQIEGVYEKDGFIRVHKSYVVNVNQIKSIKSSFNTRYVLEMKNGNQVEVSRSYYHKFKEYIGY